MPQFQILTNNSTIFAILPKNMVASGLTGIVNPERSTVLPMGASPLLLESSAEPFHLGELQSAIKEVENIWRERAFQSSEAKLITYQTLSNSQEFIAKISSHTSESPEVSGFPNGEIGLEWETSAGSLKLLIDERNSYWFFESMHGKRRKGSEPWDGTIPRDVLGYLKVLFPT